MSSAPQWPYTAENLTAAQRSPLHTFDLRFVENGVEGWTHRPEYEEQALAQQAALLNAEYERGRASRGDLLYTDNSAVVAKLSAENERLRAEVAKLKAE